MIAYLTKSDASKGFEQILDFLNASVIKKTNDVVRLQALIDRRNVIITEDTVRQALRLDDAESKDCLPNEEIFAELERMGLEESQAQVCHIDLEHADKVLSMQDDEPKPTELKQVIEVVTTAKLMTEVVTAAVLPLLLLLVLQGEEMV
nr:hypothetical protein [Tanacetum cinerariifolium]